MAQSNLLQRSVFCIVLRALNNNVVRNLSTRQAWAFAFGLLFQRPFQRFLQRFVWITTGHAAWLIGQSGSRFVPAGAGSAGFSGLCGLSASAKQSASSFLCHALLWPHPQFNLLVNRQRLAA